jgi:hypothetical protein
VTGATGKEKPSPERERDGVWRRGEGEGKRRSLIVRRQVGREREIRGISHKREKHRGRQRERVRVIKTGRELRERDGEWGRVLMRGERTGERV